jgi:UDP-glucose 4-epimerase
MVVPRFVGQALKNEPLTVYGTGEQTRTFTYVKDVVRALMGLMENDDAAGQVFNVGGTEEITMLSLAQKIIKKTGSSSPIQLVPYDEAFEKDFEDMQRRVPSIEKIRKWIGFEPEVDIDMILKMVIAYMRTREG